MNHQIAESLNSSTVTAFQQQFADAWPPRIWTQHRVLIAVSGGPDSVALLQAAHSLSFQTRGDVENLAVAHVNHGLRGRDSDDDQEFVEALAKSLAVPVFSQRLDANALTKNAPDGLEAATREARYQVLFRIAHEIGARYLATGHTHDDQIETVLFRLFRGTGVAGMAGIPAIRRIDDGLSIVRPMLGLRKAQIGSYLAELGQKACADVSNRDVNFAARNWIRHELLPMIRAKFGDKIDTSIAQMSIVANEYHQYLTSQAERLADEAVFVAQPNLLILRKDAFTDRPPVLVQVTLQRIWDRQRWPEQEMGFDQWRRLIGLLLETSDAQSPIDIPGQIHVADRGGELHFTRPTAGLD